MRTPMSTLRVTSLRSPQRPSSSRPVCPSARLLLMSSQVIVVSVSLTIKVYPDFPAASSDTLVYASIVQKKIDRVENGT